MDNLWAIPFGIWAMVPALMPNSVAVLFGGGLPVDFGRTWKGKRIFGDGKTWGGFIGGAAVGMLVGMITLLLAQIYPPDVWWPGAPAGYGFGDMPQAIGVVFLLAVGAMLGDMAGAFIKRRLGYKRGHKVPVLDQYDFVAGALLLNLIFFPSWVLNTFVYGLGWISLLIVLVLAWVLHRGFNIIGYKAGLKKEPW